MAEITVQLHDHQIKVIDEVLRRMMAPPEQPKRPFGFHLPDKS